MSDIDRGLALAMSGFVQQEDGPLLLTLCVHHLPAMHADGRLTRRWHPFEDKMAAFYPIRF